MKPKIQNSTIDPYLSLKLNIVSLLAIISILFLHSYNAHLIGPGKEIGLQLNLFIQTFIGDGLCRVAVPIFFLISGFLFFNTIKSPYFKSFKKKFQTRFNTLAIPFLIWSVVTFVVFAGISSLPMTSHLLNSEVSFSKPLEYIFINPVAYQLWFIQQLLLYVAISPILFFLIRYVREPLIVALFFAWLLPGLDLPYVVNEGIVFYSLGAYIAIHVNKILNFKCNGFLLALIGLVWFILLYFKTSLFLFSKAEFQLIYILGQIGKLVGILFVWFSTDFAMSFLKRNLRHLLGLSFFIFIIHEPLLTILKKLFFKAFGVSGMSLISGYFFLPVLCLFLIYYISKLSQVYFIKLYSLINGGRGIQG